MTSNEAREEIRESLRTKAESLGFSHAKDLASTYPELTLNHLVQKTFGGDKKLAVSTIIDLAFGEESENSKLAEH